MPEALFSGFYRCRKSWLYPGCCRLKKQKTDIIRFMKKLVIFRLFWLLVAVLSSAFAFTDWFGYTGGGLPAYIFFTSWSVWAGLVVAVAHTAAAVYAAINEKKAVDYPIPAITFCSDCMLFITAFVIMLGCIFFSAQVKFFTVSGFFKHVLLPAFAIADAFLFAPGTAFSKRLVFRSLVFPLGYWIAMIVRIVVIRSGCGGSVPREKWSFCYPYPFMNIDNGWSFLRLSIALSSFCAAMIAFGLLLVFVTHRRKGKKSSLSFLS